MVCSPPWRRCRFEHHQGAGGIGGVATAIGSTTLRGTLPSTGEVHRRGFPASGVRGRSSCRDATAFHRSGVVVEPYVGLVKPLRRVVDHGDRVDTIRGQQLATIWPQWSNHR
jgi:hypothetical protein